MTCNQKDRHDKIAVQAQEAAALEEALQLLKSFETVNCDRNGILPHSGHFFFLLQELSNSNSIKKEGLKHGIFHRKSIHNKEEGRNDICFILGGAVAPFPHLLWVFLCVSPGELLVEVAALTWQQQWQVRHLVGCIHAAEESLVETAVTRVSPWKSWCFIQRLAVTFLFFFWCHLLGDPENMTR